MFIIIKMLIFDPQCNAQRKWRSYLQNKSCRWFNSPKNILENKITEHKIPRKIEMAQQPPLTQSNLIQYQTQKLCISLYYILESTDLRSPSNCTHSKMPHLIFFSMKLQPINPDEMSHFTPFHNVKERENIFLDLYLYLDPHRTLMGSLLGRDLLTDQPNQRRSIKIVLVEVLDFFFIKI